MRTSRFSRSISDLANSAARAEGIERNGAVSCIMVLTGFIVGHRSTDMLTSSST
jgi:hypothetical protein